MPGFSSTQSTIAFSGGDKYSPTISAAFVANSGSTLMHQGVPPHKMNPVCAQHTPYMVCGYISQRIGKHFTRPSVITIWRMVIQNVQNAFLGIRAIPLRGSRPCGIAKTRYTDRRETYSPFTYSHRAHTESVGNTYRGLSIGRTQDYPSSQYQPLLGRTGPYPAFQCSLVVFR